VTWFLPRAAGQIRAGQREGGRRRRESEEKARSSVCRSLVISHSAVLSFVCPLIPFPLPPPALRASQLFASCDGVAHGEGEGLEAGYRLSGRNVVARCAGEVAQGASGIFLRTSSACLWVCDFASIPWSCCSDVASGQRREVAKSPWSLGVRSFYSFWEFVVRSLIEKSVCCYWWSYMQVVIFFL